MQCPLCEDTPELRKLADADAHRCGSCGGLFLTRGQLDLLVAPHEGDLEFSTLDLDTFSHDDSHAEIACPVCDASTMRKVEFNIYTDIILDYCGECGGFWLDGGELERINASIRELSEADREIPDPPMLRLAKSLYTLVR
jgi:Zn-finger nucleic acid-binding protein